MRMANDDTVGNGNGEGMGITLYGNTASTDSVDAVFSLCNCNIQFIMTFIIYYDNLFLVTILVYLIETVRFSDKLTTMTFYVS